MSKAYARGTRQRGSPRPTEGFPVERLYRAVRKAITAEANAKGITREAVIEQHFPGALQSVPSRSTPRRNGAKSEPDR
jgi:hypothetical protein